MTLSIIIPVYNEEKTIDELYRRLIETLNTLNLETEMIFINDGSKDKTLKKIEDLRLKDKRIKILSFSRNFGHQVAISAGIDFASGKAAIIMDADLQDPPELIPDLIKKHDEGFEVIYAKRKKRQDSFFKTITAKIFYKTLSLLSTTKIPEDTGDFRLIDRKVIDTLKRLKEKSRFVRGLTSWIGFRQTYIEFERDKRFAGETNYPLNKMIKLAIDSITGFSYKPLRLATYLGFIAALLGFFSGIYAIGLKIWEPNTTVSGWTTLMIAVFFMGGVQLIILGIIGEYIGRIYTETQDRPLYIIDKMTGFDEK